MSRDYITSVQGRWGKTFYIKGDEYVGKSLRYYGEYNPDETEYIISLAVERVGELCLDIGANIGVIAQALEKSGHEVMSFEPQPIIYDILSKNTFGRCVNAAVGAEHGQTRMPKQRYYNPGNFGGISCGEGEMIVNVHTIDEYNLSDVGLMKIDVEGWELGVLQGAVETIKRCSPIIYLEADRTDKIPALKKFVMEDLGYSWEEHNPTLYREKNFFNHPKNVWAPYNFASYNAVCRKI
jgi:FkbM family methyltransferase